VEKDATKRKEIVQETQHGPRRKNLWGKLLSGKKMDFLSFLLEDLQKRDPKKKRKRGKMRKRGGISRGRKSAPL